MAKISALGDIELVERDQIDLALQELSLTSMLGSENARGRLELGRILRADVLVFMAGTSQRTQQGLRLVVSECILGARVAAGEIVVAPDGEEAAADQVVAIVAQARERFARGITAVVGISPLVSMTLVHDWDHLQASLTEIIQNAFAAQPGIAVIEMEEAHALRREREQTSDPLVDRVVPLLVDGHYRVEVPDPAAEPRMSIEVRVSDGEEILDSLVGSDMTLGVGAETLRDRVAQWAGAHTGSTDKPISADRQVAFMLERADALARMGAYGQSTGLREACILLQPPSLDERSALIREYGMLLNRTPTWWDGTDPIPESPQLTSFVERRISAFRLCLEHIEVLLRQQEMPPKDILELCREISQAADAWRRHGYHEADADARKRHFERMERLKHDFMDRVFPDLGRTMEYEARWQSLLVSWATTCFASPDDDWFLHKVRAMGRFVPQMMPADQPLDVWLHPSVLSWQSDAFGAACRQAWHDSQTLQEYTAHLRSTGHPRWIFLAHLAELWLDRCVSSGSARKPGEGMLAAVEDFADEADEWGLTDISHGANELLRALERATGLESKRREATPTPKPQLLMAPPIEDIAPPIHAKVERLPLELKDQAGNVRRLMGRLGGGSGKLWFDRSALKLLNCGPGADVYWHESVVLLHDRPNQMRELLISQTDEVVDVVWDGERICVGVLGKGLQGYDLSGQLTAVVGHEQKLPPCDRGLRLCPIEPGRILVAGSFGEYRRAWLATVDWRAGGLAVNVFHEAPDIFNFERPVQYADPRTAFVPGAFLRLRDPASSHLLHLERQSAQQDRPNHEKLEIDLRSLSVSKPQYQPGGRWRADYVQENVCELPNGICVAVGRGIHGFAPPGMRFLQDGREVREVQLPGILSGCTKNDLVVYGEHVYFPASPYWRRLNRTTLVEDTILLDGRMVDSKPADKPRRWTPCPELFESAREVRAGVSAFHGLIVWSDQQEFCRIDVPDSQETGVSRAELLRLFPEGTVAPTQRRARHTAATTSSPSESEVISFNVRVDRAVGSVAAISVFIAGVILLGATLRSRRVWRSSSKLICMGSSAALVAFALYLGLPTIQEVAGVRHVDTGPWVINDHGQGASKARESDPKVVALLREVLDNDLSPTDRADRLNQLDKAIGVLPRRSDVKIDSVARVLDLVAAGKIHIDEVSFIFPHLQPLSLRCQYDEGMGRLALWGEVEAGMDSDRVKVLCRLSADLLAVDHTAITARLVDEEVAGPWRIEAQLDSRPRQELVIKLGMEWRMLDPGLPREEWLKASAEQRGRMLRTASTAQTSTILASFAEEHTLRWSNYRPASSAGNYWPAARWGREDWKLDLAGATAAARRLPQDSGTTGEPEPGSTAEVGDVLDVEPNGVLVVRVLDESQATLHDIAPGDVIVSMQGQIIRDLAHFLALASSLEGQPRDMVLRRAGQERTVQLFPGKIGVMLASYDPRYGEQLEAAARSLGQSDPATTTQAFDVLLRSGYQFNDDNDLQVMYAQALYLAGKYEAAHRTLEDYVNRRTGDATWAYLADRFHENTGAYDHLYLYCAAKDIEQRNPVSTLVSTAHSMASRMNRYPEALVRALKAQEQSLDISSKGWALDALRLALSSMDLREEALEVIREIELDANTVHFWGYAAYSAERFGQPGLAQRMSRSMFDQYRSSRNMPYLANNNIRLLLLANDIDRAQAFYDETLLPHERLVLPGRPLPNCQGWPTTQGFWLEVGRQKARSTEPEELTAAFEILASQTTPDTDELQAVIEAYENANQSQGSDPHGPWADWARAQLLMIQGRFAEAHEALARLHRQGSLHQSEWEAIDYLRAHADHLSGDMETWRRTVRAYAIPHAGWLLLTRDHRLGHAGQDGAGVREVGLPSPSWAVDDPDEAIVVSPAGRTILTSDRWTVYQLDLQSGWKQVAHVPWEEYRRWRLSELRPALDGIFGQSASSVPLEFVWPPALQELSQRHVPLMLADGRWLICDRRDGRIRVPRAEMEHVVDSPTEIYGWVGGEREDQFFALSSRGVLSWDLREDMMKPCALPNPQSPVPAIVLTPEEPIPGQAVIVGSLPDAGGQVYQLDRASGRITAAFGLNESYPATYWLQRTPASKRQLSMELVARAGLRWRWSSRSLP